MLVKSTMKNDVKAAMAVIRQVDPNVAYYMEASEWIIAGEEDITPEFRFFLHSFPDHKSVVASTVGSKVTFNVLHMEHIIQETGIDRDHYVAAVLVHEFKHTPIGGGHHEEWTPTMVMFNFAQRLGDETLVDYIYGRLLAIDESGQWSKVCPNCGKEHK